MRSLLFLILTILIAAGCNSKTATVSSGSINAEAPFVWESGFPKSMYISSDYTDATEQAQITEMLNIWETSINNYNFFSPAGSSGEKFNVTGVSTNSLRDNKSVIYRATKWPYPDYPDALAITQIFAIRYNVGSSDEFVSIQEADVIMNFQYFVYYYDEPDDSILDYDFRTVLLHELGHFLGLQHKPRTYNRNNTVMYPTIFSNEKKRVPLPIDRQDLAAKYSITLPATAGGSAIVAPPKVYSKKPGDEGEMTKIILELKANGECVHHMDGAVIGRHHMKK